MSYVPRLLKTYKDEVVPALVDRFKYTSVMRVPKVLKVTLNQGVGKATQEKKLVDDALEQMTAITGQKAVATMSKKDISNFKLRAKIPIGARVTLRGAKMYEFLDRFIAVTLPRVRDFRGVNPKSFDGRGNYTIGITEQIVFPEIDIDKVSNITGLDITIVTSAPSDIEAHALLEGLGMPFKK